MIRAIAATHRNEADHALDTAEVAVAPDRARQAIQTIIRTSTRKIAAVTGHELDQNAAIEATVAGGPVHTRESQHTHDPATT